MSKSKKISVLFMPFLAFLFFFFAPSFQTPAFADAPTVTVNPNGDSNWNTNNQATITATDPTDGIQSISWQTCRVGGTYNNIPYNCTTMTTTATSGSLTITLPEGEYNLGMYLGVQATDSLGNVSTEQYYKFFTDTVAPSTNASLTYESNYANWIKAGSSTTQHTLTISSADNSSGNKTENLKLVGNGTDQAQGKIIQASHDFTKWVNNTYIDSWGYREGTYDADNLNYYQSDPLITFTDAHTSWDGSDSGSGVTYANVSTNYYYTTTCTLCTFDVYSQWTDAVGHQGGNTTKVFTLGIDGVAPTFSFPSGDGSGKWYGKVSNPLPTSLAFTIADQGSGLPNDSSSSTGSLTYTVYKDGATFNTGNIKLNSGMSYNGSLNLQNLFTQSGTYQIAFSVPDAVGNVGTYTTGNYYVDLDSPTVSFSPNGTGNAWVNQPQNVTISANDTGGSGLASWKYSDPDTNNTYVTGTGTSQTITLTKDGKYGISYQATDGVGNSTSGTSPQFWIDQTPPIVSITGVTNGATYTTWSGNPSPLKATFTTSDALSGINSSTQTATLSQTVNGTTTTSAYTSGTAITQAGSYALTVSVQDNAGNTTTQTVNFTVVVDTTPPTISVSQTPNTGNWTNNNQLTISATDDASGVKQIRWQQCDTNDSNCGAWSSYFTGSQTITMPDGQETIHIEATDNAGNVASNFYGYNVDTTPPVINVSQPPLPYPWTGWSNNNQLTIGATDSGSGVKQIRYRQCGQDATQPCGAWSPYFTGTQIITMPDGKISYNIEVTDNVGNVQTQSSQSNYYYYNIDTTGPTTTGHLITSPAFTDGNGVKWYKPSSNSFDIQLNGVDNLSYNAKEELHLEGTGNNQATGKDIRASHDFTNYVDNTYYDDWTGTYSGEYDADNINYYQSDPLISFSNAHTAFTNPSVSAESQYNNVTTDYSFTTTCTLCTFDGYSIFTDKAGNTGGNTTKAFTFGVDGVAPTISFPSGDYSSSNWMKTFPSTIPVQVTDQGSGVKATTATYTMTKNGTTFKTGTVTLSTSDGGNTYNGSLALASYVTASGTYQISISVQDNVGNTGTVQTGTYQIDVDLPSATLSPNGTSGVWKANQNVTVTPTDTGGSGVASWQYRISTDDGTTYGSWVTGSGSSGTVTLNAEGKTRLQVQVTDGAGNISTVTSQSYWIDATPPSITFPSGDGSGTGWLKQFPASIPISVTDQDSGVNGTTATYTLYNNGTSIKTGSISLTNSSGTYSGTLALQSFVTASGTYQVSISIQDNVGNTGTVQTGTYQIDMDNPNGTFAPDGTGGTWTNQSQNVTVTPSDTGGSGVASWQYRISSDDGSNYGSWTTSTGSSQVVTLPATTGKYRFQMSVTDVAGNTNTVTSQSYLIDTKPPTINISGVTDGGTYTGATPSFPISATADNNSIYDLDSGINSSTLTASLSRTYNGTTTVNNSYQSGTTITQAGNYTLTVTVQDNAGNSSTKTVSFTVTPPPILNISPVNNVDTSYSGTFVYPLQPTLTLSTSASDPIPTAVITLYYDIKENTPNGVVDHGATAVSSVTPVNGTWDTSAWNTIDLGSSLVSSLHDGTSTIEFWIQDDQGASSAHNSLSLIVDSASPTNIQLYNLPIKSTVALNSSIKFSVSAEDAQASDGSYQNAENVNISFDIRKNGVLLTPAVQTETKLNGQPSAPITLFLGQSEGYQDGDVVTITPVLDDGRGNTLTNPPTYTITIQN